MFDTDFKRSYAEQNQILAKKTSNHFGYIYNPLISAIPYENFCMDTLHLELNISKYLCSLLEEKFITLDKLNINTVIMFSKHLQNIVVSRKNW